MNYPIIHNLNLKACCYKTLDEIESKIKFGKMLEKSMPIGLWVNIFGPSPSSMNTIVSVSQVDFQTLRNLVRSVAAVPEITRAAIRNECVGEWFSHSNDAKLQKFWGGMRDVFL
ncbi:MAG: hypothetical protein MI799_02825 [Desulfobacterales bacterium]|nr:hypothetical protein [Desulfobacterales bacterium]